jgi:probable HAF family extracellular repeat protein
MKTTRITWITAPILLAALAMPVSTTAQDNASQNAKHKHHQYKLIDIGTLGGPNSGFFPGERLVNNQGVVIGGADTPTPDPHAPNCFGDCFVGHTFQWQKGVLTDLGALPGLNSSGPNWMNAEGVVTGISQTGLIDPLSGTPEYDAVIWKDGQIINLGTLGGNFSYANAINDRGQVAGFALNTIPDSFGLGDLCENGPFPTQMRASLWTGEAIQDLGTLGGPDSCALWLNQSGQAAGHSFTDSTLNPLTGFPSVHPFLWDHGTMLDVGTLGGTFGLANAINNRGDVVGRMNLAGDLTAHPYLWREGTLKDLGTLGGTFGQATSVNDAREIVGGATNQNDQAFLAFLWRKGVMTDLGTVVGDDCSSADYISSGGQIVGTSFGCAGGPSHAFLWDDGGPMIDLNTVVAPGSGLTLADATFINDRGEITVQGSLPNGDTHAVLLIPCGGDPTDAQGCQDHTESTTTAVKSSLATATQSSINVTQSRLTPSELFAALRTRLAHRRRGFGARTPE